MQGGTTTAIGEQPKRSDRRRGRAGSTHGDWSSCPSCRDAPDLRLLRGHLMSLPRPVLREIELLQQAAAFLEQCRSLDEVKTIRDKAEAIRVYAKKIGESQRSQNAAAEVKIRAERRMGELI